ncbi:MAG: histidine phosphatase family protein [Candidatus Hermodarchaeota archaeon]
MDIKNIWKELDWTIHAQNLIAAINKFPENAKIIVLLRHSERYEIESVWKPQELLLTPNGHQVAREFGEKLPIDRPIRIFTSHAPRCHETANEIIEGIKKSGGNVELKGNLEPLYKLGVERNFLLKQIEDGDLIKYVQNWIKNAFPHDKAQLLSTYSMNSANIIWNLSHKAPKNCIDIHVTHEIPIMALRFGWFNLLPDKKWVNFLGGIAFTFQDGRILLFDIDDFLTVEGPHWWKK